MYPPTKSERKKGASGKKRLNGFHVIDISFSTKITIYFKKEATIRWGMISKILYIQQKMDVCFSNLHGVWIVAKY